VNFRCTSSPSTLGSVGYGFAVHGQLTTGSLWASYGVSVRSLAALAWMRRSGLIDRLTNTSAGFLPTVGHPSAVAFASYFCLVGLHLVYCPPIKTRFRTGDLHPTSSRPCRAYGGPKRRSVPAGWLVCLVAARSPQGALMALSVQDEGGSEGRPVGLASARKGRPTPRVPATARNRLPATDSGSASLRPVPGRLRPSPKRSRLGLWRVLPAAGPAALEVRRPD